MAVQLLLIPGYPLFRGEGGLGFVEQGYVVLQNEVLIKEAPLCSASEHCVGEEGILCSEG